MRRCPTILALALCACHSSSDLVPDAEPDATAPMADAGVDAAPIRTDVDPASADPILVSGTPTVNGGMSDVALYYPANATIGVMTYTSVAYSATATALATRLATSSDHGATWTYAADVNHVQATALAVADPNECPSGSCPGLVVNEVSTVLEDAGDSDMTRRWKVFTHRYFVSTQTGSPVIRYQYGHIAMYTAPAATGPWSDAQPVVGWPSKAAFSSQGAAALTTSLPGMTDCVTLTEPSAAIVDGRLLLAVGCISIPVAIRIELLASSDHGATFTRVGTLVGAGDATKLAATAPRLNAAHLFQAAGKTYLFASPGDANGAYLGCDLLELDAAQTVVRDGDGLPHIDRFFDAPGQPQRGACAFAEGATATGVVMNIPKLTPPPVWRVFRTGIDALQ